MLKGLGGITMQMPNTRSLVLLSIPPCNIAETAHVYREPVRLLPSRQFWSKGSSYAVHSSLC